MLIHSPKELALIVTSRRKELNLSQAEVANLVGLKQQTVSQFEIKPESTKLGTLFQILSAVGLDINTLAKDHQILEVRETGWKEEW